MPNFKNDILQSIKILLLAVVLSIGVSYVYAWTGPTATPPENNIPAPLNVGDNIQVKSGGLGVTAFVADVAVIISSLRIGNTTIPCSSTTARTMRYNASKLEYCNGSSWTVLPPVSCP